MMRTMMGRMRGGCSVNSCKAGTCLCSVQPCCAHHLQGVLTSLRFHLHPKPEPLATGSLTQRNLTHTHAAAHRNFENAQEGYSAPQSPGPQMQPPASGFQMQRQGSGNGGPKAPQPHTSR